MKKQKKAGGTGKTKKPTGLKVSDLILKAASKERKGISLSAVKKCLQADGYDVEKNRSRFKIALKSLVTRGALSQLKGTGASGSFKLSKKPSKTKAKPAKKAAGAAKAKKPAAMATKKPKKVAPAAGVKKSPKKVKKPAAAKSPKKPKATKKAAKSPAKAKAAKSKAVKMSPAKVVKPKASKPKKAAAKK